MDVRRGIKCKAISWVALRIVSEMDAYAELC